MRQIKGIAAGGKIANRQKTVTNRGRQPSKQVAKRRACTKEDSQATNIGFEAGIMSVCQAMRQASIEDYMHRGRHVH